MPPSSPACAPHKVWDPSGPHSTHLYRPPVLSPFLFTSPPPLFVSPSLSSPFPSLPGRGCYESIRMWLWLVTGRRAASRQAARTLGTLMHVRQP